MGMTTQQLRNRAAEHIALARSVNPNQILDHFHTQLRNRGPTNYLWIPIRTWRNEPPLREVLYTEVFWIRVFGASLNVRDANVTRDRESLVVRNNNRSRPLLWIRQRDEWPLQKEPAMSDTLREVHQFLSGERSDLLALMEVATQILRRPTRLGTNVRVLKDLGISKVLKLTKLAGLAFSDFHHRALMATIKVFWDSEDIPVVTIRPPKTLSRELPRIIWRRVLKPWMTDNNLLVVKFRCTFQVTPNLEDLCSNHAKWARKKFRTIRCP